jgi:hypothetical protein
VIPDFLRFTIVIAAIIGAVYGSAWLLASFPPEPSEIVRSLPNDKINQP